MPPPHFGGTLPNRGKPKSPKSPREPRARTPFWFWLGGHIFSLIRRHGSIALFWIGFGYCVHEMGITIRAFAGKISLADLGFSLFANVSFVWTLNLALSGLSIGLYLRERSMHRKTRERLTSRITMLELRVDPQRTSSHLTSKGLTQKEDE
jgi:hypothetical protein